VYKRQVLKMLETLKTNEVILRCSCSGIPVYKEDDLRMSMKYSLIEPTHFANKNVTFFTTIPSMTQILLKSTGEEIVEVPMGFVVREVAEVVVPEAIPNYSNSTIITSHDTKKQSEAKAVTTTNYHHMMAVTRLYHFLISVGAVPNDISGSWSGNERVQGNTIHSNLFFRSYYRYKKMSFANAQAYLTSIVSGYKEEPKNVELSMLYCSYISVFQTYPMYVPIRASGSFVTPPDDVKRVVYIYDCIASYVNKMHNLTYYKVSYDTRLVGNYNYFISEFRNAGENIQETPGGSFLRPKFKEFGSFKDFKMFNGITVGEKFEAVAKFFRNLGRNIQLNTVGQSKEIADADCGVYSDPLTDFYSYRDKQKNKPSRLLVDELLDDAVDDDEMEARKKKQKEVEKRPDFDGYYEIPGERQMGGARPAQSSEGGRGRGWGGQRDNQAQSNDGQPRGRGRGWGGQRSDEQPRGRGWGGQRSDEQPRGRGWGGQRDNQMQLNDDQPRGRGRGWGAQQSSNNDQPREQRDEQPRGRGRGWGARQSSDNDQPREQRDEQPRGRGRGWGARQSSDNDQPRGRGRKNE